MHFTIETSYFTHQGRLNKVQLSIPSPIKLGEYQHKGREYDQDQQRL